MEDNQLDTLILCISGKRFSGKDTIAHRISEKLDSSISFRSQTYTIHQEHLHIASFLKKIYAEETNAEYERLLHDRDYKVGDHLSQY